MEKVQHVTKTKRNVNFYLWKEYQLFSMEAFPERRDFWSLSEVGIDVRNEMWILQ